MKVAIVTAVCGDKSKLEDPENVFKEADYFAFTDNYHESEVWSQIPINKFTCDTDFEDKRNSIIHKVLPHLFLPDYDAYIWTDATHELILDPQELCVSYLKGDMALFKHNVIKSAFDEMSINHDVIIDDEDNIKRQRGFYKKEMLPDDIDYYESSGFARKNNSIINTMCLKWWEQICRFSSRDQMSLVYCLWRMGIEPSILPGNAYLPNGNDIIVRKRFNLKE